MNLWLRMAVHAGSGRADEYPIDMTGSAIDLGVPALKGEKGMIEIVHAVYPIMALQAGLAKPREVLFHISSIFIGVAVDAGRKIDLTDIFQVAGSTGHRIPSEVLFMPLQAEAGLASVFER
jgi:hypothetical protein